MRLATMASLLRWERSYSTNESPPCGHSIALTTAAALLAPAYPESKSASAFSAPSSFEGRKEAAPKSAENFRCHAIASSKCKA
jgi:hypothetical protein